MLKNSPEHSRIGIHTELTAKI